MIENRILNRGGTHNRIQNRGGTQELLMGQPYSIGAHCKITSMAIFLWRRRVTNCSIVIREQPNHYRYKNSLTI